MLSIFKFKISSYLQDKLPLTASVGHSSLILFATLRDHMLENKRVRFMSSLYSLNYVSKGTTVNDSYESPKYFSSVLDDKWSGDLKNDSISKLVLSGSC